jgi:hypothetical protein
VGALALAVLTCGSPVNTQTGAQVSGGKGTLYVAGYPGQVSIVDEATEQVAATIPLQIGIPIWWSTLSSDRRRFYIVASSMESVEIVDLIARKSIDRFSLTDGSHRVRIMAIAPEPQNRFVMLLTRGVVKRADRFEIEEPKLVKYDLGTHAIVGSIEWPFDYEEFAPAMRFSPDGTLLYVFGEDVLIYETAGLTKVDSWDFTHTVGSGLSRPTLASVDSFNDEAGVFTGLFTVEDEVQRRPLMGIGRVNLAARTIEFSTVGPAEEVSFALTPDRARAYGVQQDIGRYEIWTFDVKGSRVLSRTPFRGRPRMALKPSSNGRLLYIYQAGSTIDLYDAATANYLRTITLGGDMVTDLFVIPPRS